MDQEEARVSEQELHRQAKYRLAVIKHAREVTGNVAQTCRYYGSADRPITAGPADTRSSASTV